MTKYTDSPALAQTLVGKTIQMVGIVRGEHALAHGLVLGFTDGTILHADMEPVVLDDSMWEMSFETRPAQPVKILQPVMRDLLAGTDRVDDLVPELREVVSADVLADLPLEVLLAPEDAVETYLQREFNKLIMGS